MLLKNIYGEKSHLFNYLRFCSFVWVSLCLLVLLVLFVFLGFFVLFVLFVFFCDFSPFCAAKSF